MSVDEWSSSRTRFADSALVLVDCMRVAIDDER